MEKVCQTIVQTIYDTVEVIEEEALSRAIEVWPPPGAFSSLAAAARA